LNIVPLDAFFGQELAFGRSASALGQAQNPRSSHRSRHQIAQTPSEHEHFDFVGALCERRLDELRMIDAQIVEDEKEILAPASLISAEPRGHVRFQIGERIIVPQRSHEGWRKGQAKIIRVGVGIGRWHRRSLLGSLCPLECGVR
jgi:hypothetical protein